MWNLTNCLQATHSGLRCSVFSRTTESGSSHKSFLSAPMFPVLMSSLWTGSPSNTDILFVFLLVSILRGCIDDRETLLLLSAVERKIACHTLDGHDNNPLTCSNDLLELCKCSLKLPVWPVCRYLSGHRMEGRKLTVFDLCGWCYIDFWSNRVL